MVIFQKTNRLIYRVLILIFILFVGIALLVNYFVISHKAMSKEEKNIIELNKYMNKNGENDKFDGCILVVKDGKVLLDKAYGLVNKAQKIKATTEDKFLIGSITKQFTAVAIMQLQEKGLLNVKDTIDKFIPGFSHGDKITIHELLTHTSGLPSKLADIANFYNSPYSVDETVQKIKGIDIHLLSEPGASFNYSDFGYMLLSYIIQKTSGKQYEDYIEENILGTLEMNNSGFGYDNDGNGSLALGYDSLGNLVSNKFNEKEAKLLSGAGEIYSTTKDLYKWDRALYTEKLLSKKSIQQIYTPYKENYGYGWDIISTAPKEIYEHGGSMSGFSSCITRLVGFNSFIIVLSNNQNLALTVKIDHQLTGIICK